MQLQTQLRSTFMRVASSATFAELSRRRARVRRRLSGQQASVQYFHQADDPYSHLAVQKLDELRVAYDLPFVANLVPPPQADFQGDAGRFAEWALRDANAIAPFHGVAPPFATSLPAPDAVHDANSQLAEALDKPSFATVAAAVGQQLWAGELPLAEAPKTDPAAALSAGEAKRNQLGHYYGAMFYFDGEWYWGLDRLHLLELRLQQEGFARDPGAQFCAPLPEPERLESGTAGAVTLEYFPSLRSPYTAVGHNRVDDLVKRTGVNLVLRPVMPMMMRGIPAPRFKQRYILLDAAREARFYRTPYGRFKDPFGDPVRRAFSFFPAAQRLGRGMDFVGAYLRAAFTEGLDITRDSGLATVAESAGLNWQTLQEEARNDDWQALLEENVNDMLDAGLWGVPSFRVSGGDAPPFACWGQDRIWRVETEIARRAG